MPSKMVSKSDLVTRIRDSVEGTAGRRPPFTLVMGSGFSFGLAPTTSQIVRDDLPWWMLCNADRKNGPARRDFKKPEKKDEHEAALKSFATDFWQKIKTTEPGKGITLDAEGLPEKSSIVAAYTAALSAECGFGLNTPDKVRRYFADVVARIGHRLNPAHLYLAALAAESPGLLGTIFTTNFDPLVQRAMQLVNVPYYVSDRPDVMQHPDDDEDVEALHLVYAHGSVYRYLLLNSKEQIEDHAERNQALLQEYFRKHAVLLVGYSGWDDAITRALKNVAQFDHNLYWCDRGPSPESSGLTPDAIGVLDRHPNAFYVKIDGADQLMLDLYRALTGNTLPRFFREPIVVALDQLKLCDLSGMKVEASEPTKPGADSSHAGADTASSPSPDSLDLGDEVQRIRQRLEDADRRFKGGPEDPGDPAGPDDDAPPARARIQNLLTTAADLYFSGKYAESISLYDIVLEQADMLDSQEKALTLFRRGVAYAQRGGEGDTERASADFTTVIDMPDATAEQRARALIYRGHTYAQRGGEGDTERASADFTTVIDMPDATAEQRAMALFNRGVVYAQQGDDGDTERAIADYTTVIDMPDATAEQRANALVNRGIAYTQRGDEGDIEREIADYTTVINMQDATAEQRVMALNNRGITYSQRGGEGDTERASADYTTVIDMPDAPAEQRAKALINRGDAYGKRSDDGDTERAIADYTAVIDMPDATAEQRAKAERLIRMLQRQKRMGAE